MKRILIASTALALFAGVASASVNEDRERPDTFVESSTPAQTTNVDASLIFSTKELERKGLEAGDTVEVTVFPSTGIIDAPGRDG